MWVAAELQPPPSLPPTLTNRNLKSTTFVVLNILHYLTFSQNQLLKLADNKYNSILGAWGKGAGRGVKDVLGEDVARQTEVAQGVPVGQGSGFS
jgi:hypothetical protein